MKKSATSVELTATRRVSEETRSVRQQHEGRWKVILAEPTSGEAEAGDTYEPNDERDAADQPPTIDPGVAPVTPAIRSS